MQSLIIHGRQPAIGRAELESLYGADRIKAIGSVASLVDLEPSQINFSRLGGMVKFAKILTTLDTKEWPEILSFLKESLPQHLMHLPEGKLRLGLSAYGMNVSPATLHSSGLILKKICKANNQSVRYVPNVQTALNSAQVLHNKLTQKLGWELLFVADGNKTIVAQSIAVQDIEKYAARDQKRPYRDSRVGMLPPKLAQTILNLAVSTSLPSKNFVILDPFCGTGVVIQEAILMGYGAHGSDIDKRMVDYTTKNIHWLVRDFLAKSSEEFIESKAIAQVADATTHTWTTNFHTVAGETYLGRPFSSRPDSSTLKKVMSDCDIIHKKFLKNLANQTKSSFRLCLAVPVWRTEKGFHNLPILDHLEKLGYNRLSFVHVKNRELVYHRPGQIVGRELVVAERI